jgi:hypothetical protein
MAIQVDQEFSRIVDAVAKEIVSTEHFGGGSIIKVPLIYPSGAGVVIEITQHQERFFVSDMGMGSREVEMYGAGPGVFNRIGIALAEDAGIRFDNQAFFVAEASRGQLASATTMVANCSSNAVAQAVYKTSERRYAEDADAVYIRLKDVFRPANISRNVEFMGASTHKWPVSNVVNYHGKVSIFDPVRKSRASVVNAVAKFHDIARLERPPKRFSVVANIEELGDFVNVLSQASSVIQLNEKSETIIRMAEAA